MLWPSLFSSPLTVSLFVIRAGIRGQRNAVAGGNYRIGQNKIAVKAELQERNAGATHGSVAGGIGGMHRGAFGKRLRKEPRAVLLKVCCSPVELSTIFDG